jgi:hypothetical protein
VMDQREREKALREPFISFLQRGYEESGQCVIGFACVIEVLDTDGARTVVKLTSDAGGQPLAWHTAEGFTAAMAELGEIDEDVDHEELT